VRSWLARMTGIRRAQRSWMSPDRDGAIGIPEECAVQSRRGELCHPDPPHRDLLALIP
jgi:hypothetical protein